jgi:hypothetical protein
MALQRKSCCRILSPTIPKLAKWSKVFTLDNSIGGRVGGDNDNTSRREVISMDYGCHNPRVYYNLAKFFAKRHQYPINTTILHE